MMPLDATFPPFIQALSCHRGGRGVGWNFFSFINYLLTFNGYYPFW
jgi:hypothetical protein